MQRFFKINKNSFKRVFVFLLGISSPCFQNNLFSQICLWDFWRQLKGFWVVVSLCSLQRIFDLVSIDLVWKVALIQRKLFTLFLVCKPLFVMAFWCMYDNECFLHLILCYISVRIICGCFDYFIIHFKCLF